MDASPLALQRSIGPQMLRFAVVLALGPAAACVAKRPSAAQANQQDAKAADGLADSSSSDAAGSAAQDVAQPAPTDSAADLSVQDAAGPECAGQLACAKGTACFGGQCVPAVACTSDKNCTSLDAVCAVSLGICVQCSQQVDCAADLLCKDHVCRAPSKKCTSSKECTADQVCDKALGQCVQCADAGDCGPQQICIANVCAQAQCQAGAKQCKDGQVAQVCTDGAWIEVPCASDQACDGGGCVPLVCTPAKASCVGNAIVACNAKGTGNLAPVPCASNQKCIEASGGPQCSSLACVPGSKVCLGNAVATCSADGSSLGAPVGCPEGSACKDGVCGQKPLCTPGAVICLDAKTIAVCIPNGSAYEPLPCTAGKVCSGGKCVAAPTCTAGATQCAGTVVQTCAAGAWQNGQDCAATGAACVDGVCKAKPCAAGEFSCVDGNPVVCKADGTLVKAAPCEAGTVCVNKGDCKAKVCVAGTPFCQGNVAMLCDATGTGQATVANCAEGGKLCQDGACKTSTGVCGPGAVSCGSCGQCSGGACLAESKGLGWTFGLSEEDERLEAVVATSGGHWIVGGMRSPGGQSQWRGLLMRYSATGQQIWKKLYQPSGSPDNRIWGLAAVDKGGVAVGVLVENQTTKGWTFGFDEAGATLWTSLVMNMATGLHGVCATATGTAVGGYKVIGTNQQGFVAQLASMGQVNWSVVLPDMINVLALHSNADGSIVVVGETFKGGVSGAGVAKLSLTGAVLWQTTLATGFQQGFNAVAPLPGGGLVAAGWQRPSNAAPSMAYTVQLDGDGKAGWQLSQGDAVGNYRWESATALPSGAVVLAGGRSFSASQPWKLSGIASRVQDGKAAWLTEVAASPGSIVGLNGVALSPTGSLLLAGMLAPPGASWADAWLLPVTADGSVCP